MTDEPINDDLVTIQSYSSTPEAQVACSVLRNAGIDAFVPNTNATDMLPHLFKAINPAGVKLLIKAEDAQVAAKVLQGARDVDMEEMLPSEP